MSWSKGLLITAAIGGLAWWQSMKKISDVRGLRNNNPLNIEKGAAWEGLDDTQTDGRFAQFTDPRYGYRAAARILKNYKSRGVDTLREIITTWAPPTNNAGEHENFTDSYAAHVSAVTGIGLDEPVLESDYPHLFAAMTKHENGINPYSVEFIAEGVSWA